MIAVSREKRWIVLGDDGRHITLGRYSDPSEEEIARAGDALRANGQGGWLAMTEGAYYGRASISVLMVREIAEPRRPWEAALAAFYSSRVQTLPPAAPYV
jgi:hypothetical protein